MCKLEAFKLEHIRPLLSEGMNSSLGHWSADDYAFPKHLAENSFAATGLVNDEPVFCGFVIEIWTGRGYLVSVLSEKIKEHAVSAHRLMREFIKSQPYQRLEMDSPVSFILGHRRAKLLGFEIMCPVAKKYLPDGGDASIYSWVRA